MKPSPLMNKVGSGPMQLTGPLSIQAPPYVRCYTPPSNNTNTVGQAITSPTDYQIILKFMLLTIRHYPAKCEAYLIFVIFLHSQIFWRIKFTPKNTNFLR